MQENVDKINQKKKKYDGQKKNQGIKNKVANNGQKEFKNKENVVAKMAKRIMTMQQLGNHPFAGSPCQNVSSLQSFGREQSEAHLIKEDEFLIDFQELQKVEKRIVSLCVDKYLHKIYHSIKDTIKSLVSLEVKPQHIIMGMGFSYVTYCYPHLRSACQKSVVS